MSQKIGDRDGTWSREIRSDTARYIGVLNLAGLRAKYIAKTFAIDNAKYDGLAPRSGMLLRSD